MARFRATSHTADVAEPVTSERPVAESGLGSADTPVEQPNPVRPVSAGSRDVFDGVDKERFERLTSITIRADDRVLAAEAVRVAAAVRSRMRGGTPESDVVLTRVLARFLLAEAMGTGVFDPWAAFRRVNVDRYLAEESQRGPRSVHTRMWRACQNFCVSSR